MGRKNRRKKTHAKPIRSYKYVSPWYLDENYFNETEYRYETEYLDDYSDRSGYSDRSKYSDRSGYSTDFSHTPYQSQNHELHQQPVQYPRRGEIWFVRLGYHSGSSVQNGSRPALIISNNKANRKAGTFTVIPMTAKIKKLEMPTHVMLGASFCEKDEKSSAELFEQSMLLVEQITTIGQEALLERIGRVVDNDKMGEIERAVETQVGISGMKRSENTGIRTDSTRSGNTQSGNAESGNTQSNNTRTDSTRADNSNITEDGGTSNQSITSTRKDMVI